MLRRFTLYFFVLFLCWNGIYAVEPPPEKSSEIDQSSSHVTNDFFPPLVSFFLPGLDQWIENQQPNALIYSLGAAGGMAYSEYIAYKNSKYFEQNSSSSTKKALTDETIKHYTLGQQIYNTFGGLSAYDSFRLSVSTRKKYLGEYSFLKKQEPVSSLSLEAFNFKHLLTNGVWIPLVLEVGLISLVVSIRANKSSHFSFSKGFFTTAFSYNAGLWEECVFRGWFMPYTKQHLGSSDFLSNLIVSTLFAAVHYQSGSIPWPQFILGYHLGNLTINNDWLLGDSIFLHTWWDIIAIGAESYLSSKLSGKPPIIMLPPLQIVF